MSRSWRNLVDLNGDIREAELGSLGLLQLLSAVRKAVGVMRAARLTIMFDRRRPAESVWAFD